MCDNLKLTPALEAEILVFCHVKVFFLAFGTHALFLSTNEVMEKQSRLSRRQTARFTNC
jgi:hypothetical protein